ncbi:hypothetical protein G8J22_00665 [Lentilactobacillus hilgardii]|uniref:hypothetical protein n=1 Tax=Lentilactobacillus hilgardii TaxID=1588 RepID=UPI00019C4C5C|nr:hypothetical protein [Lentilactobacillus hilgardii]EEI20247.1 type IIG restriction enzyme and methyltransferase [Lentilactobacillus buchneri ATCC 11577]QIR08731.1 hypothetical protein G8J22_00665 [Lentilactobacillus hilgardii]
MAVKEKHLKESINKAVQAMMPQEEDKEKFKNELVKFMTDLRDHFNESEENQKKHST